METALVAVDAKAARLISSILLTPQAKIVILG
jgi:hypothetical protein